MFAPPERERTGAGRFDDPRRHHPRAQASGFRVVYCSTSLYGSFVETLQKFRPSLATLAGIGRTETDVSDVTGTVPSSWVLRRHWGRASLSTQGQFVDCAASETFASLREQPHLAAIALELGVADIDISAVTSPHRLLTQAIAAHVHESIPDCAGIRYVSRFGTDIDFECWAVFADRVRFRPIETDRAIPMDQTDFQRALSTLKLSLDLRSAQLGSERNR